MGILEDIFTAAFQETEPPEIPDWIEWVHISDGLSHCEVCLKLDKCWFVDAIKPILPQHPHCHCTVNPIPFSRVLNEATSECDIRKFSEYVLHPENNKGKKALFEAWGYDIMDSEMLQKIFEKQALERYIQGQYELGKLNEQGQRISIQIELKRRNRDEIVTFISGWMVYPDGRIRLITPYGGTVK